MFVLKYVCIKICLFLMKKQQKNRRRPTDRPTARAATVPRSVGRSAAVFLLFFIKKQTYFNTNIFKNKHILKQTY